MNEHNSLFANTVFVVAELIESWYSTLGALTPSHTAYTAVCKFRETHGSIELRAAIIPFCRELATAWEAFDHTERDVIFKRIGSWDYVWIPFVIAECARHHPDFWTTPHTSIISYTLSVIYDPLTADTSND